MKYLHLKVLVSILFLQSIVGLAPVAESAHRQAPTPAMRRQHNSMSVTNKQWAVCKRSLEAGDFAAAGTSLARMQKAAGDLEKFKLHKNAEMTGIFKEQADNFQEKSARVRKNDRGEGYGANAKYFQGHRQ